MKRKNKLIMMVFTLVSFLSFGMMSVKAQTEIINNIELNGSSIKPVVGETPKFITIPEDLNYYISSQTWYDGNTNFETEATTFEAGIDYGYLINVCVKDRDEYTFSNNTAFNITNVDWVQILPDDTENYECYKFKGIYRMPIIYNFLEGNNLKTIDLSKLKFRIDVDYSKFEDEGKVFVDNVELTNTQFTSESGSTIITLDSEYASNLEKGNHTLRVEFNDGGKAETTFTIETNNPQTGDNVVIYLVIGLMSLVGLVGTTVFIKRA